MPPPRPHGDVKWGSQPCNLHAPAIILWKKINFTTMPEPNWRFEWPVRVKNTILKHTTRIEKRTREQDLAICTCRPSFYRKKSILRRCQSRIGDLSGRRESKHDFASMRACKHSPSMQACKHSPSMQACKHSPSMQACKHSPSMPVVKH